MIGGRVREQTARRRRNHQHTILTAKRIEGEEGKRRHAEGKVVVCFLGESAIVVPAAWVKKLPIIY